MISINYSFQVDIPAFDWPIAKFPRYKYPLAQNSAYNKKQDQECLADVEAKIAEWKRRDNDVAAIIVEPIQAEGGDHYGSPAFFQGLRDVTAKHGIVFIVDEVQTGGGATGDVWAHDHWNLSSPPDIVTFSKKLLTGGYFYGEHLRVKEAYRIYNTWMGDPTKLLLLEKAVEVIKRDGLIEQSRSVGAEFQKRLEELQASSGGKLDQARGRGTFAAVDFPSGSLRDKFVDLVSFSHLVDCVISVNFRQSATDFTAEDAETSLFVSVHLSSTPRNIWI